MSLAEEQDQARDFPDLFRFPGCTLWYLHFYPFLGSGWIYGFIYVSFLWILWILNGCTIWETGTMGYSGFSWTLLENPWMYLVSSNTAWESLVTPWRFLGLVREHHWFLNMVLGFSKHVWLPEGGDEDVSWGHHGGVWNVWECREVKHNWDVIKITATIKANEV